MINDKYHVRTFGPVVISGFRARGLIFFFVMAWESVEIDCLAQDVEFGARAGDVEGSLSPPNKTQNSRKARAIVARS
jgi:hypothetical protein